jgi:hypothetical protein
MLKMPAASNLRAFLIATVAFVVIAGFGIWVTSDLQRDSDPAIQKLNAKVEKCRSELVSIDALVEAKLITSDDPKVAKQIGENIRRDIANTACRQD